MSTIEILMQARDAAAIRQADFEAAAVYWDVNGHSYEDRDYFHDQAEIEASTVDYYEEQIEIARSRCDC